jgi:hypothetical protein
MLYLVLSKQKEASDMRLNEKLKICLLALESRHPKSLVEINGVVLGHLSFLPGVCTPSGVVALLEINAPHLLHTPACLVIDAQTSEIYLVEQSREVPAFWIYSEGCPPPHGEEQMQKA